MNEKMCSVCKIVKPVSCFTKKKSHSDGLNSSCKDCRKIETRKYRENNKINISKKQKEFRDKNKNEYSEKRKRYRAKNLEKIRKQERESKLRRGSKVSKYLSKYRENNKEKQRLYMSEYMQNNLGKFVAAKAKRKAAKTNRTPLWFEHDKVRDIYVKAQKMRESGLDANVDHIIPLQGKLVSGLHCFDNLQIITAYENRSKGNRYIP